MIGDIARCNLSPNVVAVSLCSPTPTAVAFVGFDEAEEGAVVSVVDSAACAVSATATTTTPSLSPGAEGLAVEVDLPPTAPSLNPLEEETDDDDGGASAPLPPVGCPLPPPNPANPGPEPDDAEPDAGCFHAEAASGGDGTWGDKSPSYLSSGWKATGQIPTKCQ